MSKKPTDDFELDDIINNIKKSVDKNKKKKQDSDNESHLSFADKSEAKEKINEKKLKNELFGDSIIDYYAIVGASREDTQETIVKKCNQKMAEYHQDKIKAKLLKYPAEDRKKHQTRYQMQYELIREARDILINPDKKKHYDMQKKSADNSNFINKKQSFEEFIKLQESEMTDEKKQSALLTYKTKFAELDKKHGFDSTKKYNNEEYKFSQDDFKRRYEDIEIERSQQDADCLPKKMFENGGFNGVEFNRQWDLMQKKKESRKTKKSGDKTIIQWEGVSAFNDHGACGGNYVSITEDNEDFGDLYTTKKEKDFVFASKLDSEDEKSLSSIDPDLEEEIEKSCKNDYDTHNKNKSKKELDRLLEEKMRERNVMTTQFHMKDYRDVQQNPFNVSAQMGEIIGNNICEKEEKRTVKNRKEMLEAYKALMYDNAK